ncbi:MAG: tetratricopeptide repeat protein [Dongiaceae bacterium]
MPSPDQPQLLAVALDCARRGDFKGMSEICRQILQGDPEQPDALHCMGLLQRQTGDTEIAVRTHERAVRGRPDNAEYRNALGLAYRAAGRIADAIDAYEAALSIDAEFVDAYLNLGVIYLERGDHRNAIARFRAAVDRRPSDPPFHVALGKALSAAGDSAAAMESYRRALSIAPNTGPAWSGIGELYLAAGDERAAMTALADGITNDPRHEGSYLRLAPLLLALGQSRDGVDCLRRGVEQNPGSALLRVALARVMLRAGLWDEAWVHYERRLALPPYVTEMRRFVQPLWDGGDPAGMTICVQCEPSAGESIALLRYLEPLAERGARIVLRCPPPLRQLLSSLKVPATVRSTEDALPSFDQRTWLGSLPLLLKQPDPGALAPRPTGFGVDNAATRWAKRCAEIQRPIIGLHWRGTSAGAVDDPHRLLMTVAQSPGSLIALQDRTVGPEIERAGLVERVIQVGAELRHGGDIVADVAAAAAQCDLVIAVDSAIAQIAATLGCRTIVLIRGNEDFWWPAEGCTVPWIGDVHLHRRRHRETDDSYLERLQPLLAR